MAVEPNVTGYVNGFHEIAEYAHAGWTVKSKVRLSLSPVPGAAQEKVRVDDPTSLAHGVPLPSSVAMVAVRSVSETTLLAVSCVMVASAQLDCSAG